MLLISAASRLLRCRQPSKTADQPSFIVSLYTRNTLKPSHPAASQLAREMAGLQTWRHVHRSSEAHQAQGPRRPFDRRSNKCSISKLHRIIAKQLASSRASSFLWSRQAGPGTLDLKSNQMMAASSMPGSSLLKLFGVSARWRLPLGLLLANILPVGRQHSTIGLLC